METEKTIRKRKNNAKGLSEKSENELENSNPSGHTKNSNGRIDDKQFVEKESGNISNNKTEECAEKSFYELKNFSINLQLDLMTLILCIIACLTRFYKLSEPNNVVFDELHYGKYVSLYLKNTFFFEKHPPLGKQLIAAVANIAGYNGNYTFSRIGSEYTSNVPIFWLRFLPALFGSFLAPAIYKLLLCLKINRWISALGGFLIIFDNALLTQSRFILMEPMMLFFSTVALIFLIKFLELEKFSISWWINGLSAAVFYAFSISIKYVGFYTYCLGSILVFRYFWQQLSNKKISDLQIIVKSIIEGLILIGFPILIYLFLFYIHLNVLYKAGPHDSVMTSAFQASLEGGLASITRGQPLKVVHGSQITLRHTNGRACWLHSHAEVYPVRYTDQRGSSHQQQVTCYSFKDVNNWWIVKRPQKEDFSVGDEVDIIKNGDIIQLVHGLTSRALNSHDVAAPVTPSAQEVSCYIDYNISMPAQILWRVDILNKEDEGDEWHAIKSHVRFVHINTGTALRFTGRQLPAWGYNQHEIAAEKNINHPDTVWNVEEHRYTKTSDQKERERQIMKSELIPMEKTKLNFWRKFTELQTKMLWHSDTIQNHMYSSTPLEWPFLNKGIAYWYKKETNAQIHLLGNILLWYSASVGVLIYCTFLLFYFLRRSRHINDLNDFEWNKLQNIGFTLFCGYLSNFIPYFFVERTLFLHNYLPALVFKICLLCYVIEHLYFILKTKVKSVIILYLFKIIIAIWLSMIIYVYIIFSVFSYGQSHMTVAECLKLRWKDTWDFIFM